MSNVVYFPTSKAMACVDAVQRLFAAMPAWVTGCAPLNKDVTHMQRQDWTVLIKHDGQIVCKHPKMSHLGWIELHDALVMQRFIDRQ